MRFALLSLWVLGSALVCASEDGPEPFQWPGGAVAAVCLTYDDGLDGHLDVVWPDLEEFGFKGTFYCTGNSASLARRTAEWSGLAEAGHEVGNHSLFHPCQRFRTGREEFGWVKPEYDLGNYTVEQMLTELTTANTLLKAVDGQTRRTYGYTCSDYYVGENESFVDELRPRFTAARIDGPLPASMDEVDLHFMPSWMVDDHTGADMIAYVEQAVARGTVATIMFHSVEGDYLNVSRQAHRELLQYLADHRETIWVATFMELTDHIRAERARLNP